jgi:hypothetical protein
MSYQLHIQEHPGYLHFQVTGENTVEAVRGYFHEIWHTCAERGCHAILIEENLTGPGLKLGEIFNIVSAGSERPVAHLFKLAYVDTNPEHSAKSMGFAETVARNRGIDVRVFSAVQEAKDWLRRK